MIRDGYSLVKLDDGSEVQHWPSNVAPPDIIRIADAMIDIHCPQVGGEYEGYKLVERWRPDAPTQFKRAVSQIVEFDGTKTSVVVTLEDISVAARIALMTERVMLLRGQKIDAGIAFPLSDGARFQTRADDRENVSGAAVMATLALLNNAQPGDLRWHGGEQDFGWIAADNSIVPMDALTVIAFGKAIAARKSACIFYARYLKDQIDAATDHATLDGIDVTLGWPE